jgi:hypothetical protein
LSGIYNIGLAEKEYDQYWYDIPKLIPPNVNPQKYFDVNIYDKDVIVEHLSSEYGYPKEHLYYLFEGRF